METDFLWTATHINFTLLRTQVGVALSLCLLRQLQGGVVNIECIYCFHAFMRKYLE